MKTEIQTLDIENEIHGFISAYKAGMNAWERAGKIIVKIMDHDPRLIDKIIATCPSVTHSMIHIFERIGRGLLLPALAMDSSAGASKLRDLPISLQRRYECEPVPLLINTETGTDTLLVDVKNMTRGQARQVFAKGRIRSEGEQRAWLVEQQSKSITITQTVPSWRIKNGRVVFEKGATLSAGELATIITQITK